MSIKGIFEIIIGKNYSFRDHNLTVNLDFLIHISTFITENTPKIGLLSLKTIPKHYQNNPIFF